MVKIKHTGIIFRLLMCSLLLQLAGCGEQTPDCFQSAGETVREEISVPDFQNITVFENVSLVLQQGEQQRVILETGKNLRPEVSAEVVSGTLELRDSNDCNFFRAYGKTVVTVITPDLESIRSSTGWPIRSEGPLEFTSLRLFSESFTKPESETTDGSFDLELNSESVRLTLNGISSVRLRGTTEVLEVNIGAGDSRVDASELLAQRVRINHRGSNRILVRPEERLEGVIRGYGDVLSYIRPPEVDVAILYKGRLLFLD
jgi:hypothetical protein